MIAVGLLMGLPILKDIPQGLRIFIATIVQGSLWLVCIRASLGEKFYWYDTGFSFYPRKWIFAALLLCLIWSLRVFILEPLSFLSFFSTGIEALQTTLHVSTILEYILLGISTIIISPIIEEVLFRGFVYRVMRSSWSPFISTMTSSLIFGLAHGVPLYTLNAFLLGIPLAWLYERSGSLVPAMVFHVANNALFFTVMLLLPTTT